MEVDRRELGVAGLPHEPEHVACLDLPAVDGERRVGREMRVVELVAGPVAEPEAPAADVVPADREHRPVGDREQRRSERREDVLAVMPAARDVARGERRTCPRTRPARRPGRRSRRSRAGRSPRAPGRTSSGGAPRGSTFPARAGRSAGSPGAPAERLGGHRRLRRRASAGAADAGAETRADLDQLPAASPPWSAISLTRSAGDRCLGRARRLCTVSTTEPSSSSVPQSASGMTAFGDGVISWPSTVRPVTVEAETFRTRWRSRRRRSPGCRANRGDLAAEERDRERADGGLGARRDPGWRRRRRTSRCARSSRLRDRRSPGALLTGAQRPRAGSGPAGRAAPREISGRACLGLRRRCGRNADHEHDEQRQRDDGGASHLGSG